MDHNVPEPKLHQIEVLIEAREIIPGTVESIEWTELHRFECEVDSKKTLFMGLLREFGRCTGKIPFGYTFEGKLVTDDGSTTWWETRVTVLKGATPLKGFDLV